MIEIKLSGGSLAAWVSAGCSLITLVIVMWSLKPWTSARAGLAAAVVLSQPESLVKVIKLVDETPLALATRRCNETAKVWMDQIEKAMRSNKKISVIVKLADGESKLRDILGPYIPEEKVEWVEILPSGAFSIKFVKEHYFDLPLAESQDEKKFVRILIGEGVLKGKMLDAKTHKKGIPVKILAFDKPQKMSVDPLDIKHVSMVPGVAKMLGVLPSIVAIVCYKSRDLWLMAPQLNGQGKGDNPGLIKDLLKIDDHMSAEMLAKL